MIKKLITFLSVVMAVNNLFAADVLVETGDVLSGAPITISQSGVIENRGIIDTDMNACFSEEDLHYIIEEIPADRIGKPEEAAKLCYLLAEAPEYLTGQIIAIDGGWM